MRLLEKRFDPTEPLDATQCTFACGGPWLVYLQVDPQREQFRQVSAHCSHHSPMGVGNLEYRRPRRGTNPHLNISITRTTTLWTNSQSFCFYENCSRQHCCNDDRKQQTEKNSPMVALFSAAFGVYESPLSFHSMATAHETPSSRTGVLSSSA